jgi:hypothetical protein
MYVKLFVTFPSLVEAQVQPVVSKHFTRVTYPVGLCLRYSLKLNRAFKKQGLNIYVSFRVNNTLAKSKGSSRRKPFDVNRSSVEIQGSINFPRQVLINRILLQGELVLFDIC